MPIYRNAVILWCDRKHCKTDFEDCRNERHEWFTSEKSALESDWVITQLGAVMCPYCASKLRHQREGS